MKHMYWILVAFLISCGNSTEVVEVFKGDKGDVGAPGADGTSVVCVVNETEEGISFDCTDGNLFTAHNGANGQNGADGADGVDGQDGTDGTNGLNGTGALSQIVLGNCTLIETGLYAKLVGQGSLKLYSTSACSGNSTATLSSTDELYILSGGDLLIFQSTASLLYKFDFAN